MAKPSDQRFPTVGAFVEAVTGQPLTLSRGPGAAPAAGAEAPSALRRVTTGDAFARTMGSGNHGDSPVGTAPGAPRAAALSPLAPPSVAPTVDVRATEGGAPRRRPTAAIVAIALAGAAIAGGGIYFALQRPAPVRRDMVAIQAPSESPVAASRPPHEAPAAPAAPTTAAAPPAAVAPPADQAGGSPSPVPDDPILGQDGKDAGAASKTALSGTTGRGHAERTPATRPAPHPAPPADAEAGGDPDARDKLQQAEAALAGHDYDRAERLANAVINSSASARQRASARLIHGTVQCAAHNDQEAAQIDLRALDGFRALRARLVTECRRHGVLTTQ
jgi:flagellar hook-length control protein FliK